MSKYYAVKNGRQTGIFSSWEECEEQVKGFKGSLYKSFPTKEKALEYIGDINIINTSDELMAYVDGSYNHESKVYGYGCVLLQSQEVIQEFCGNGDDQEYALMRNVAGEIMGSEKAIQYAIDNNYKSIYVYYDYEGIEKWATGIWKTNRDKTLAYQNFMKKSRQKIQISFVKVLAHSGDIYNDRADKLARTAVGL